MKPDRYSVALLLSAGATENALKMCAFERHV